MKLKLPPKLNEALAFGMSFSSRISRDRVSVYAAQAGFFIVISFVPFVMLLISLLQYVVPATQQELGELAMEVLPAAFRSYADRIIEELYTQTSIPLVSATTVSILWSASKSIYALMQGLNEIYQTAETRNGIMVRISALINTLLLIAILIASLLLLVFGKQLHILIVEAFPIISPVMNILIYFRSFWCVLLMVLGFTMMYKVLPNVESSFWSQLPGAMFTTVIWLLYSFFYSYYIENFSNFSVIYGSLAAIVFMMLWLYFCMKILLIGGELNMWLAETRGKKDRG